jgi:nucleoside-diphosphate-sugar epimerase
MQVLVVGAGGAIGTRLVPQLREQGHTVVGSSRSEGRAAELRGLGAEPIVIDALDRESVRRGIAQARPDAIVYEATALTDLSDFKHFDRSFHQTNLLRTHGIDILLSQAREAGVGRIVAQSYALHRYARKGAPVQTEDDTLDPDPPKAMSETMAAMAHLDQAVTAAGGIALRYGSFYGDPVDPMVTAVMNRKWPVIGDGGALWCFIHLEDAARATVLALEHSGPAVFNVVDDEPAPTGVWLPELARILGAKPPQHYPRALAQLVAGEALVVMSTESRGASNSRAKRELGWTLRYPSWRQGFRAAFGQLAGTAPAPG